MIPQASTIHVDQVNVQREIPFGIKRSGLSQVLQIMRSHMYSNSVDAVIREYSCSAADAHTEAGMPERPIEVRLPNTLQSYFQVRDYGRGLSPEEIEEIFVNYGESTKRGSNDYIGQLGIGAKSAFAYGDSFAVTSIYAGKKYEYAGYIDASQIGMFSLLSVQETDEPSGVCVSVPVKESDYSNFRERALAVYVAFQVPPVVLNDAAFAEDLEKASTPILKGEDWAVMPHRLYHSQDTHVVMGNISYALDTHKLYSNGLLWDDYYRIQYLCFFLYVPIGAVEISASRETLRYTPETVRYLVGQLTGIGKQISAAAQAVIDQQESISDAYACHAQFLQEMSISPTNELKWRDQSLPADIYLQGFPGIRCYYAINSRLEAQSYMFPWAMKAHTL